MTIFVDGIRFVTVQCGKCGVPFALRAFREAFGMTQGALAQEIGVLPTYLSNAERGKYVPRHAQSAIDAWMAKQEPAPEPRR